MIRKQRERTRAVDEARSASAVELAVAEGRVLALLIALHDTISTTTHCHDQQTVGTERIRVNLKARGASRAVVSATNTVADLN